MKLEEVFPKTIKDYGNERWGKRFYRNFPIERQSRRRRYYDDYYNKHKQPEVKQPKPEPKPPKAVIENRFVLKELTTSGYGNRIYGKFQLSTGETVQMQLKAKLVVDYINSGQGDKTVFVLGPGDHLYLEGGKEYHWRKANAKSIASKHLVPGYVYWCVSANYDKTYQKEITESQQLYLGKVKMTGVSQRHYEMVDVWYDIVSHTFTRYATPKQQLHKFGEPEQNIIRELKAEGERVLVGKTNQ